MLTGFYNKINIQTSNTTLRFVRILDVEFRIAIT